jgi:hypothetical protein
LATKAFTALLLTVGERDKFRQRRYIKVFGCGEAAVGERLERPCQTKQHVLRHILGICLLQATASAPAIDFGTVTDDERVPGRIVALILPDAPQE